MITIVENILSARCFLWAAEQRVVKKMSKHRHSHHIQELSVYRAKQAITEKSHRKKCKIVTTRSNSKCRKAFLSEHFVTMIDVSL